jgi:hypothetical protein
MVKQSCSHHGDREAKQKRRGRRWGVGPMVLAGMSRKQHAYLPNPKDLPANVQHLPLLLPNNLT